MELPQPSMQPAIERGQVAAAMIVEPTYSSVRGLVRVVGQPYDAIAKSFLISEWFTTPEWLKNNPAPAKKLVGVIYDTARWANAHQTQSLPMLAAYFKLDAQKLQNMTRAVYATNLAVGDVQPVIDLAVKYGAVQRPLNASDLIAK
jgi:ABC-type nitrate/sulfonate/bicarbonate transport system substrate-binding protein